MKKLAVSTTWLFILSTIKDKWLSVEEISKEILDNYGVETSQTMLLLLLHDLLQDKIVLSKIENGTKLFILSDKGKSLIRDAKEFLYLLADRL